MAQPAQDGSEDNRHLFTVQICIREIAYGRTGLSRLRRAQGNRRRPPITNIFSEEIS